MQKGEGREKSVKVGKREGSSFPKPLPFSGIPPYPLSTPATQAKLYINGRSMSPSNVKSSMEESDTVKSGTVKSGTVVCSLLLFATVNRGWIKLVHKPCHKKCRSVNLRVCKSAGVWFASLQSAFVAHHSRYPLSLKARTCRNWFPMGGCFLVQTELWSDRKYFDLFL